MDTKPQQHILNEYLNSAYQNTEIQTIAGPNNFSQGYRPGISDFDLAILGPMLEAEDQ
jgi:hypothetical protein